MTQQTLTLNEVDAIITAGLELPLTINKNNRMAIRSKLLIVRLAGFEKTSVGARTAMKKAWAKKNEEIELVAR